MPSDLCYKKAFPLFCYKKVGPLFCYNKVGPLLHETLSSFLFYKRCCPVCPYARYPVFFVFFTCGYVFCYNMFCPIQNVLCYKMPYFLFSYIIVYVLFVLCYKRSYLPLSVQIALSISAKKGIRKKVCSMFQYFTN